MKLNIPFYSRNLCSGCMLCSMACSLTHTGECSVERSILKVHTHPYLNVTMISSSMACDCPDGHEKCEKMCNQKALKFVPRENAANMLTEMDWICCPLL